MITNGELARLRRQMQRRIRVTLALRRTTHDRPPATGPAAPSRSTEPVPED